MRHILWIRMQEIFSGGVMVLLLLGAGIYLTFKFGFFQLRGFRFIWKNTVGTLLKKDNAQNSASISPFQAVTTERTILVL